LVNGVKDKHMEELPSRSSGEYSYMLTHKLEDVLTLARRVEELGKEMSTIKRYLNQFT
jgi:hypothetical protein